MLTKLLGLPNLGRTSQVFQIAENLLPNGHSTGWLVFSKRQRITLRLLYAIAIPSVVCLSVVCLLFVTLVHPTQRVEIFGNFVSPYDSPGTLVF